MSFSVEAPAAAALRLHWRGISVLLHEVMLRLCHGCIMVTLWLLLQLLRQLGERLCYGCRASQERKSVSAVPMGPRVIFQPLNLCLAHPGCSKPWEQQDNWHHEQDQQDSYVQEMQQVHLDQSKDFS